jgi:FlaA1/EpsC-like NDP-sugar epimerase
MLLHGARMKTSMLTSFSRRRALVVASQIALTALAWLMAFAIAYDFQLPQAAAGRALETLPWLLALRLLLSHRFRIDRSSWQHVSLPDLINLVAAATIGSVLLPVLLFFTGTLTGIPVAIFFLDWVLVVMMTAGVRITARWLHERGNPNPVTSGRRTFIIGAGDAGEQLLRQILHDPRQLFHVVRLIDDDPAKLGLRLHGVPVVGPISQMKRLAALHQPTLALIAIPSAPPEVLRRIVEACSDAGLEVRMLPPFQDLLSGDVEMANVREVRIEDLLGREPIVTDVGAVGPEITGKVVLVTGAGGSIGSELVRQIARFQPHQLILLERAESPLYFIHHEVCRANPGLDAVPVLASVTNLDRLQQTFETYRPDVVFHAAAYKHVPMLEWNIVEGVWNNVMGTLRVARCAARAGTGKFVFISTDKAVNPVNVLGITKRIAERIVLELPSLRSSGTDFRVVRFGNVLGSDGSVVPLFKKQLEAGGPLTVTHPEVKRYFMTIPEAVQLVLQSATLPEAAGRIALLEMGTQIKIVHLAEQLIRLHGLTPGKDIEIVFTGLRPGEKLEEELLAPGEVAHPTSIEKIRVVECSAFDGAVLAQRLRNLLHLMARHDEGALIRALATLVPDHSTAAAAQSAPASPSHTRYAAQGNGNGRSAAANGNGRATRRTITIREARGSQVPVSVPASPRRNTAAASERAPRKGNKS